MKKITSREKFIMILAVLLIAVLLFEHLFLSPLKEETVTLKEDIQKREEILMDLAGQQMGYDSITKDLNRSIEEYKKTIGQFPAKWDDSMMLKYIEDIIGDRVVKESLTFNGLTKKDNYYVGTYSVNVKGHFDDFMELLFSFSNAKYFNTISAVNVPKYSYENEEVTASFTINFYVLSE
ncbi:MAG: hypothetical protein IJS80_06515 [Lachnospiraceae bacterium]|nr:hypothetical protein [Lachnospiraceae bacterium]